MLTVVLPHPIFGATTSHYHPSGKMDAMSFVDPVPDVSFLMDPDLSSICITKWPLQPVDVLTKPARHGDQNMVKLYMHWTYLLPK